MSSAARSHSRHLRLGGDVDGTLGEQAVRQEVAVAAYPPHGVGEFEEAVAPARLAQPERLENDRLADSRSADRGHRDPSRSDRCEGGEGALARAAHQRRCSAGALDHPDDRHAVVQQCDQRRPHRHAADEVLGAVDRVDHPLPPAESRGAAELLTQHRIIGPLLRQGVAQRVSTERSASVTGVRSGLVSTRRSSAPNRSIVSDVRLVGQSQSQRHVISERCSWLQSYHDRVWEFAMVLLLLGALAILAAPWIRRRRGVGSDWVQGPLLVTGVSPRPDADRRTARHDHRRHQRSDRQRARRLPTPCRRRRPVADDGPAVPGRVLAEEPG